MEGKRQSLGSSFRREPVADSSERQPNNMADDECASLRVHIRANACLRVTVLRANVGGESRRALIGEPSGCRRNRRPNIRLSGFNIKINSERLYRVASP